MIVVDTSVWISFFRDEDAVVAEHLQALLDADQVAIAAPVRIELLSGASRASLASLKQLLEAPPILYPTAATWQRIDLWIERAVASGDRFGMGDLLIGAIAAEHDCPIWSLDTDFGRMARLKLLQVYRP